jgi:cell division protein FtsI (penicillin-binding protein 3)
MKTRKNDNRGIDSDRSRLHWLTGIFVLLNLCVIARFLQVQVIDPDPWRSKAPAQYENRIRLAAKRGLIYDRHKKMMAMDLPSYSLALDPLLVRNTAQTAETLSEIIGIPKEAIQRSIDKHHQNRYLRICEDISEKQRYQLRALGMRELIVHRERKRTYPFNDLARSLLGLTDARHEGISGIELTYNETLSGKDGWTILQRDGLNRNFTTVDYPLEPALDGQHIVLTIDYLYQTLIEEVLKEGLDRYEAKWGSAILMHPVTGEILAMVSLTGPRLMQDNPDFQTRIRNRAIQDNYEPGSVFKVVTLAAAIEEKIVKPQSLLYCENGDYVVSGNHIGDDHRSFQWLTVKQAMQVSSNIGLSKLGRRLGKQTFYRYIQNFGFGNRSGIGLAAEASGLLRPLYQWDEFLNATVAFGQGVSVTTLQLACMLSAIANGGELMKPQIVRAILDADGHRIQSGQPVVIRRVISDETARTVTEIMESCVNEGTGIKAAIPGLRLAGKTGTAQKSVPGVAGYLQGAYESSFIGFWPSQSPEFVLVVTLDEPRHETTSAQSAARIFARMVERISGLPPTQAVPEMLTEPQPVFTFSSYEKPVVYEPDQPDEQPVSPYFVPDVVGLSTRKAITDLAICGITVSIEGHGRVRSQNLKPGIRVKERMNCHLVCE